MAEILEIYNNGTKIGEVPAIVIQGRTVIETTRTEYDAEQTHTPGAIYFIAEDD